MSVWFYRHRILPQPSKPTPFAPDRFARSNISLASLLIYVHQVAPFQIVGGPEWVRTARFTVEAKADGRLGPKLKPSAIDCPAIVAARGTDYRPPTGPPQPGDPPRCGLMAQMGGGSLTIFLEGQPISQLVRSLQINAGRVIVDKTGLTGTYDVEFQTEMPNLPGLEPPPGATATPPDGLSLFTALPEQLGLKLESERGPVDVVVIDSAQLPTPN